MEPNNYYNERIVGTFNDHDSEKEVVVIEPMASVPASMRLADKGIHITPNGRCVCPRYAGALRRYLEKSGVLETALNGINEARTPEAGSESVVADVQVAGI